jgi:signal transduction histidine kinase
VQCKRSRPRYTRSVRPDAPHTTDLGRAELLLRVVGAAIWAFLGVSRWLPLRHDALPAWAWPWIAYGACYLVASLHRTIPRSAAVAGLAVQTAAAAWMPSLGFGGFEGLLLSIVVVQLPTVLSLGASLAWATLQVPLLVAVVWPALGTRQVFEAVGAYSTFCAFGLLLYRKHRQELLARRALAAANAEILAMRALLVARAREGERLRISRELHDSLGHQLTALRIQLELAAKLADGESADAVRSARAVSQEAIDELRRAVGALRTAESIDVTAALQGLASAIPAPRIHFAEGPQPLDVRDPALAHAIVRCTEEAVTNAVKHAAASNVWIEARREHDRVELRVADDGRGAEAVSAGNGLTGMRERVAELGGTLEIRTAPGEGFEVRVVVPLPRSVDRCAS